jgi:hypothetical protein
MDPDLIKYARALYAYFIKEGMPPLGSISKSVGGVLKPGGLMKVINTQSKLPMQALAGSKGVLDPSTAISLAQKTMEPGESLISRARGMANVRSTPRLGYTPRPKPGAVPGLATPSSPALSSQGFLAGRNQRVLNARGTGPSPALVGNPTRPVGLTNPNIVDVAMPKGLGSSASMGR